MAFRDLPNAGLVAADHLAQVFGIEPSRKRSRAHEIAEHDRDLAALRLRSDRRLLCRGRDGGNRWRGAQRGDGLEQPAPVTNRRDAEILQVFRGQARQQRGLDMVLLECRRVLLEAERPQLIGNIRLRRPRGQGSRVSPAAEPCRVYSSPERRRRYSLPLTTPLIRLPP
jgi:hypothetical protein